MSEFEVEVTGAGRARPAQRRRLAAGPVLRWLLRPRLKVWALLAAAGYGLVVGTPHLMITYRCHKAGGKCLTYSECRYVGVQGWRNGVPVNGQCSYVRIMPIDWS